MGLFEKIDEDLRSARMRRDEIGVITLGLLKSEVVTAGKERGADPTGGDELVVRIVRKEVKKREEAADAFTQAGRPGSADKEMAEARILGGYLPPAASEEDIEVAVRTAISELGARPDFGAVMKLATAAMRGRASGGELARVAKRILG
ncbi:MAG: GatB/YqeY domain-containing protein [Candidatus Dormibacteraceae bacterium]